RGVSEEAVQRQRSFCPLLKPFVRSALSWRYSEDCVLSRRQRPLRSGTAFTSLTDSLCLPMNTARHRGRAADASSTIFVCGARPARTLYEPFPRLPLQRVSGNNSPVPRPLNIAVTDPLHHHLMREDVRDSLG